MFDTIYNFINAYLLSTNLGSEISTYNSELSLILSYVATILIFAVLVRVIVWCFSVFTGFFNNFKE